MALTLASREKRERFDFFLDTQSKHMPPEKKSLSFDRSISSERETEPNHTYRDKSQTAMSDSRNNSKFGKCTCIGASAVLCAYCQTRTSETVFSMSPAHGNNTFSAPPRSHNVPEQTTRRQSGTCSRCDNHQNNIREHFSVLKGEITVDHIIDGLHDVLSNNDIEDLQHIKKRRKRAEFLLKRVLFHGHSACRGLLKALVENDCKHIFDVLHNHFDPQAFSVNFKVTTQLIRNEYETLVKRLPVEEVADRLIDFGVFDIDDHETVMQLKVRKTMAEKLMNKILNMPQQSQEIFVYVLQQCKPDLVLELFRRPHEQQQTLSGNVRIEVDNSGIEAMDTSDITDHPTFRMSLRITNSSGEQQSSIETHFLNAARQSKMEFEEVVRSHTESEMEVDIFEGSVIIQLHPKSIQDFEKFREATSRKEFEEVLKQFLQVTNMSQLMPKEEVIVKVTFSPQNKATLEIGSKQIKKALSAEEKSVDENRAFLLEELNPIKVVDLLKKTNILSNDQVEWIKQKGKTDRRSQVGKLIQVLLNSDDHAIKEFKAALEGSRQMHIVEHIGRRRCNACLYLQIEENESILAENLEISIVKDVLDRCVEYPENLHEEITKGGGNMHTFFMFLRTSTEALIAFEDIMHATGEIELLGDSLCATCSKQSKSMDTEQYLIKLKDNFDSIKERINAKAIVGDLLERGAINYKDKAEIINEDSTMHMNELLLKKILERGPKACVIFFGVLFDQSYESILQPMDIVHPRSTTSRKSCTSPKSPEATQKDSKNTLMVAAIDFGTTYSGIAYSFRKDYGKIPLYIDTYTWDTSGLVSLKTPTTLLLDREKSFAAFGFEAEDMYNELLEDNEHGEWFYFKQFKMMLHRQATLNRKTLLQDSNGHKLPALDVFSHSIRYLKQQLHAVLDHKGADVRDHDIFWVLTVPAIWNDAAKQFMREAAEKAGIPNHQLSLALEPEAASVYVKEMSVQRREETKGEISLIPFTPGTKYMVLDLGGGTVDITVREVLKDRTLKELYKATGGDWGGTSVNQAMFDVLEDLVGDDVWKMFKEKYKPEYNEMEKEIEMKKRAIKPHQSTKVTMHFPVGLRDIYRLQTGKELKKATFEGKKYAGQVEMRNDKIRLNQKLAESFFDRASDNIIKQTKEIFSQTYVKGTRDIMCVGGFAECDIVINKIKEAFPEHNVMVPQDAGLAVLKGAVLYGQNPKIVSTRIIRYTYGNAVHRMFWGDYDPVEKFVSVNGKPFCKDVFNKLVEVDTQYQVGETVKEEVMPLKADMTKMSVHLYRSTKKTPRYVTDEGCERLGTITVDMPNTEGGLNRKVIVSLTFGNTELIAEGKDETTGKSVTTSLDLLSEI